MWWVLSAAAVSSHPLLLQALQDAGLPADGPELKDINKARCGILIGSAMGGLQTFAQAVEDLDFKVSCQGSRPSAGQLPSLKGQQGSHLVQCLMRGQPSVGQLQTSSQAVQEPWTSW